MRIRPIDCRTSEKYFPYFIDNTLSEEETESFLEHIRTCPRCRSELETDFMIVEGVRLLDAEEEDFDLVGTMETAVRRAYQYLRIARVRTIAAASVNTLVFLCLIGTLLLELRILLF